MNHKFYKLDKINYASLNIFRLRKVHIFWEGHKILQISTLLLSYVVPVKSKVEISQNCVAFSEYMNFNVIYGRSFMKKKY